MKNPDSFALDCLDFRFSVVGGVVQNNKNFVKMVVNRTEGRNYILALILQPNQGRHPVSPTCVPICIDQIVLLIFYVVKVQWWDAC